LRLGANGNKSWDNVYSGDGVEYMASVITRTDGSFLLAGTTGSDVSGEVSHNSQGNLDFWIIKADAFGSKLWDKRFGGSGPDRCSHAIPTFDNGYLLCGFTVSPQRGDVSEPPKGIQDYWVVKVDSAGNKLLDRPYGGSGGSFGTYVLEASGGAFFNKRIFE
jgi:hypothetical protein